MKILLCSLVLLSFSVSADDYKAPAIKLGLHPHSEPTVKGESDWDDKSYKVQETQDTDRALASEVDKIDEDDESTMLGRNPSSKERKELNPEVMYWKWDK